MENLFSFCDILEFNIILNTNKLQFKEMKMH